MKDDDATRDSQAPEDHDPRGGDPDRDPDDREPTREFDEEAWRKRRRRHRREVEKGIRDAWDNPDDQERPRYTPWLVIRYAAGDYGFRPIPGGTNYWKSPDIWIESSNPSGNGVAGEDNFVWVRIFNLGMAPSAPVKVDFYWANPALGLGAANMNLIGTEWTDVPSQSFREVRCNSAWVPVFVNNGHECLKVNCTDPILDPITAPFQPKLDRHVGQRNVTVLEGAAGARMKFDLELNNFLPISARIEVLAGGGLFRIPARVAETLTIPRIVNEVVAFGATIPTPEQILHSLEPGTAAHRNATVTARLAARRHPNTADRQQGETSGIRLLRSAPRLAASISESRTVLLANDQHEPPGTALQQLTRKTGSCAGLDALGRRRLETIEMQAYEGRRLDLELQVPDDARPGDLVLFEFAQQSHGVVLGGYAVVIHVTEDAQPG